MPPVEQSNEVKYKQYIKVISSPDTIGYILPNSDNSKQIQKILIHLFNNRNTAFGSIGYSSLFSNDSTGMLKVHKAIESIHELLPSESRLEMRPHLVIGGELVIRVNDTGEEIDKEKLDDKGDANIGGGKSLVLPTLGIFNYASFNLSEVSNYYNPKNPRFFFRTVMMKLLGEFVLNHKENTSFSFEKESISKEVERISRPITSATYKGMDYTYALLAVKSIFKLESSMEKVTKVTLTRK
ncbi:MAG: hypothetical protein WCK31_00410 [bacterium]